MCQLYNNTKLFLGYGINDPRSQSTGRIENDRVQRRTEKK